MKKKYYSPEWDFKIIQIQNIVLLTGSVEQGGDILDQDDDDIPEN